MAMAVIICPNLEIVSELVIRDHVNCFQIRNWREIIQNPLNHRFPCNLEQRFGFLKGERIKPCGITGGKDKRVHGREMISKRLNGKGAAASGFVFDQKGTASRVARYSRSCNMVIRGGSVSFVRVSRSTT